MVEFQQNCNYRTHAPYIESDIKFSSLPALSVHLESYTHYSMIRQSYKVCTSFFMKTFFLTSFNKPSKVIKPPVRNFDWMLGLLTPTISH